MRKALVEKLGMPDHRPKPQKRIQPQGQYERDLLVKKITDKIAKASFVDTIKLNEDKVFAKRIEKTEYGKAYKEFVKRYGLFGEKLQTEEELKESQKHGSRTMHFMDEISEFKEISEKYFAEDKELEKYREQCKNEAMDLLKEHFFALWD